MTSLRRRLVGAALVVVAVAAFAFAADIAPTVVPESAAASADVARIAPSPVSGITAPALLAVGSVLLVAGGGALIGADLSARATLLAPALGAVAAFAVVSGIVAAPAAVLPAFAETEALMAALTGWPGTIAAGSVVGATVAPVVRAATTEDTITLLGGAALLLIAVAAASDSPLALAAGGVAGAGAVGLLWAVDPATWRP